VSASVSLVSAEEVASDELPGSLVSALVSASVLGPDAGLPSLELELVQETDAPSVIRLANNDSFK
jgi:hypothetical protein